MLALKLGPFLSLCLPHLPKTPENFSALVLLLSQTPPLSHLGASATTHSVAQALSLLSHCPSTDFSP